jgi:MFS transporter, OFA family, oxalate/formate antiporter
VACSFGMTTTLGLFYSYTDFFLPLSQQFNWNHALTSTVPAVSLVTFSLGTVLVSFTFSRAGFRRVCYLASALVGFGLLLSSQIDSFYQLLFTFSVMIPLGISILAVATTALVVKWFVGKRGLAVGLMTTGSGAGTLVISPVAEYIIVHYGWRLCFTILGGSFLLLLFVSSYFMRTPEEFSERAYGTTSLSEIPGTTRKGESEFTTRNALSTSRFRMMYAVFFLGSYGTAVFTVHAIPYATTQGISEVLAAEAVGVFGVGSIAARLASGRLAEIMGGRGMLVLALSSEFVGVAALPYVGDSILLFSSCAFAIGLGNGLTLANMIVLTGDMFGRKWIERIWAIQETAYGSAGLVGPIAVGAYFDMFGSYTGALQITAIVVAAGVVISIFFLRTSDEKSTTHMKKT